MRPRASHDYRFGDLLALARQDWVLQMSAALAKAGHADYRVTDAAAMRILRSGPLPIGRLAEALGITRQAARKVSRGLEERGYATAEADPGDARRVNVTLTSVGLTYAAQVTRAISRLNRRVVSRIAAADLALVDSVLRTVIADPGIRRRATQIPPP